MSADPYSLFKKDSLSQDFRKLAEEHIQHDLQQSDRDTLKSAAGKLSTHAKIGTFVGLGLGLALAWRIRSNRLKLFEAFRTSQKPTHVKFADGREALYYARTPYSRPIILTEAIPDITPYIQPTLLGDIATYTFFSIAGLFLGGETGMLSGASAAKRTITKDPETRARIEKGFRAFRADVLRKQVEQLEKGGDMVWI